MHRLLMDCKLKNVISSTLTGLHFHFTECLLASEMRSREAEHLTDLLATHYPLILHRAGLISSYSPDLVRKDTGLPPLESCLIYYREQPHWS